MALVAGLILAGLLAVFTYGHPGWSGRPTLTPRAAESWRVQSILFLTQEGFPWGRAVPSFSASNPKTGAPAVATGDSVRFAGLAVLYAELATSDAVKSPSREAGR